MVMFDNLEDIFQNWRDFNEYSKALVTLATAIGTVVIGLYSIKLIYNLIQAIRLYVCSQWCCTTDYRSRYGQWVVISGATDGIGLAMAKDFARRGHSIVVIGRNEERLANAKTALENEPNVGEIVTIKIDLSDSSIENFERIRDQIDPDNRDIGILVNNAGTFPSKLQRFNNVSMEDSRTIVNLNILAPAYLTKMIMPGMLDRGRGLVVNVSSIVGSIPNVYAHLYGPTKTFINAFSRQIQIEYSSHPVDIINLTPGAVKTKLFTNLTNIQWTSPFNPTAEDYAKSAINALSTRINSISGTMNHGFQHECYRLYDSLGLIPLMIKTGAKFGIKDFQLSPVLARKVNFGQTDVEGEATSRPLQP